MINRFNKVKFLVSLLFLSFLITVTGCLQDNKNTVTQKNTHTQQINTAGNLRVLVAGDVSDEPSRKIRRYQPFVDYLTAENRISGISEGKVVVTRCLDDMIDLFKQGEVHIIIEGAYNALRIARGAGTGKILLNSKGGDVFFESYIITLRDSPLSDLNNLKGKVLALEDQSSTSAYFSPFRELKSNGLDLNYPFPEKPYSVTVKFSGEDELIIQDLFDRKADAGAYSDYNLKNIDESVRSKLKIIHTSDPVPRSLLLISPSLNSRETEEISTALRDMKNSEKGREVLEHINSTGFFSLEEYNFENKINNLMEEAHEAETAVKK